MCRWERLREKVAAAVVCGDGPGDEVALCAHVRARLRSTKTPEAWFFRAELPYSETGKLLRRIMGGESLRPGDGFALGPLKLLIDERDPPDPDRLADRIRVAREQRRAVAAHCVTALELALYLGTLELAGGARRGDRIEHGGVIPDAAIAAIRATPLTVVTNPGFIRDRGDRYLETIAEGDRSELYRARSLLVAGIPLAAGSDAPYATADSWTAMRAARDRRTAGGHPLGQDERIPAERALRLYLGRANDPGGPPKSIAAGEAADLILCEGPAEAILADLCADRVRATVVAGDVVFNRA